ncbi:hypothetical protein BO82DRAFT_48856 [Aspergillus uvarum CBS 121591]|uniref:Uncharacterized protein n=1 Tax=Aspergillus uvarum CBS 121591 TaxID=1448315 RepID=A0A319CAX8_9EURO|nr:hypothetical protein BO82DRAFT_48856 [Aspergillus uvarum CBS 121591]PYH82966.1 hypothetical protein BO82DRAFT_48856 [Aspergillus uvarum CBS 121591]
MRDLITLVRLGPVCTAQRHPVVSCTPKEFVEDDEERGGGKTLTMAYYTLFSPPRFSCLARSLTRLLPLAPPATEELRSRICAGPSAS